MGSSRHANAAPDPARFTPVDGYRTAVSALMVVLGVVILSRTLALGFHVLAAGVGLGFLALGAYRLSFVVAYMRRARSR
jgi:hypothetical protein